MKLKVKKEGKTENYNLINSWSEVNLEKWGKLLSIKSKDNSVDAIETLSVLTDMPKKIIRSLNLTDVSKILSKVAEMQKMSDTNLVRVIEIDGKEYGFHPNLDEITLGEYADIETLIKDGNMTENLPELMAILYRPITEKKNDIYSIEAYDGQLEVRREIMKGMKGEQVQSALVFFWILGKQFLLSIPSYLQELSLETTMKTLQETTSEKGGVGLESSIV